MKIRLVINAKDFIYKTAWQDASKVSIKELLEHIKGMEDKIELEYEVL